MLRSLLKVGVGLVLMFVGLVLHVALPLITTASDASMADALVNLMPYVVFLIGLVAVVVGLIQFAFRTVRKTVSLGRKAMAGGPDA